MHARGSTAVRENTPRIIEQARAKLNLTLKVLGKRSDGYHELESLVAFADVADVVTLDLSTVCDVTVSGPFGPSIAGENLIRVAIEKLLARAPGLQLGHVTLDKRLPIAAGIGGGSADAAAVLRAIRTANPDHAQTVDWMELAAEIGADVPVCFQNKASVMRGLGERLALVSNLPALDIVLVNPRVAVAANKTALVFKALAAKPFTSGMQSAAPPHSWSFATQHALVRSMRETGNDLLTPASSVVPDIELVMDALRATAGADYVALSGGGPTCFAVYQNSEKAAAAAEAIRAKHPSWWVTATKVA